MKKKSRDDRTIAKKAISNFFIINGWIIAIFVIAVGLLWFFGVFDFFKYAAEDCSLGDGFICDTAIVSTTTPKGKSNGNASDMIAISLTNTLGQTATSFSITSPHCDPEVEAVIDVAQTATYTLTHCEGLKARELFKSTLNIRYATPNATHVNHGTITKHVVGPTPENFREKKGRELNNWLKRNIG